MINPVRNAFIAMAIALALAACGGPGAAVEAPAATLPPSPTPPPIPTHPLPTTTFEPTEEIEVPVEATPASDETGSIVYVSLRENNMRLYLLSGNGFFAADLDAQGGLPNVVSPDASPDGQRLAFAAATLGGSKAPGIYVSNIQGGEPERLTTSPGDHPAWSPDGSQIAYTCGGSLDDVCVINADGSGQQNLTASDGVIDADPDWMPDGRIVFMSNRDTAGERTAELYIMNADGTNVTRLTTDGNAYNAHPAVSPDGSKIAFDSNRDVAEGAELYVLDVGSRLIRRLTVDEIWNQNPIWAPDSEHLLFAAFSDAGNVDLYQIRERDVEATRMTHNPAEDGGDRLGYTWLPSPIEPEQFEQETPISEEMALPAGTTPATNQILFAANNTGCADCLETGIYSVTGSGDSLAPLPVEGLYPTWSPDFTRIAYSADGEVMIANADGSNPTQLTHAYQDINSVEWDSSGAFLVTDCMPYGEVDVCLVDATTGAVSNLTGAINSEPVEGFPHWAGEDISVGSQLIDVTGALVGTLPYPGRVSPAGDQLAAIVDQQVNVMDIRGGNVTTLLTGPATKGFPVWSPGGDRLLYTVAPGGGGLYLNVSRADGTGAYRLIDQPIAAGPAGIPEEITTYYGYSWAP